MININEKERLSSVQQTVTRARKSGEEWGERGGGGEDVTSGLGLRKPRTRTRARPFLARVALRSTREDEWMQLETLATTLGASRYPEVYS